MQTAEENRPHEIHVFVMCDLLQKDASVYELDNVVRDLFILQQVDKFLYPVSPACPSVTQIGSPDVRTPIRRPTMGLCPVSPSHNRC